MKSESALDFFPVATTLNARGKLIDLSRPQVMGILNVTPDSFFDGGKYITESAIIAQAGKILAEGATFIDVGAYSSRPGADDIPEQEEMTRSVAAIRSIHREFPKAIIAVDTFRSKVAEAAVDEGATLINDISAGELDLNMPATVARLMVPYVAMHMRGTPATMKSLVSYDNLIKDIVDYFHRKLFAFHQLGIKDLIIDPGFGFAKTIDQNFQLLQHLDYVRILGKPILAGLSRKSMIWKTLHQQPNESLNGTTSLNTIALMKGASILRVHDVKAAVEAVTLFTAMQHPTTKDLNPPPSS
ncbi:MAG: dihydropteroate synthase [Chryseolinea sp.]